MIGDFGDRTILDKDLPKKWKKSFCVKEASVIKVIKEMGAKVEPHRVLLLVDLNGIYMKIHEYFNKVGIPINGGLILSRFAFFQFYDAFEKIKKNIIKNSNNEFVDLNNIIKEIRTEIKTKKGKEIEINPSKTYLHFLPQFDLCYAPSPHKGIEQKFWNKIQYEKVNLQVLKRLAKLAKKGKIDYKGDKRDYLVYDDFIKKLKSNPEYSRSEEGFFCYNVGPKGLSYFKEKEVDTRIVIRAMDAIYNYEADVICVVSSDQDFLPLRDKTSEFGINFFQADLAKFDMKKNIGRKIKDLGPNFIEGKIDPEWPLKIICEAAILYKLDKDELNALCKIHNQMNDYHIKPNYNTDGDVDTLYLSKPSRH